MNSNTGKKRPTNPECRTEKKEGGKIRQPNNGKEKTIKKGGTARTPSDIQVTGDWLSTLQEGPATRPKSARTKPKNMRRDPKTISAHRP